MALDSSPASPPEEPSSAGESAHDVLAAEEFAMPAGAEPHEGGGGRSLRAFLPLALAAVVLLVALRRRR